MGTQAQTLSSLSQALTVAGMSITCLGGLILNADPTVALGAATKQYVDNKVAGVPIGNYLPLAGGVLTGNTTLNNTGTASPYMVFSTGAYSAAICADQTQGSGVGGLGFINKARNVWTFMVLDNGNATHAGTLSCSALFVNSATAAAYLNGTAGNYRGYNFQSSGVNRWAVGCEGTAEGGSNAGSNFSIDRYSDNGTWIESSLNINRATGQLNTKSVSVAGTLGATGQITTSVTGTQRGVFESIGDNGTSWNNWTGTMTACIEVDCPAAGSQYNGIRWTRWGGRHLAAIGGYEGGSGTSAPMIGFQVDGETTPGFVFQRNGVGTYAGTWTQASDYRIKTNVVNIDDALAAIEQIRPVEFNRTDGTYGDKLFSGVIAHELQAILPHLVTGEKDGMQPMAGNGKELEPAFQAVDYTGLIPYLIRAIQQLSAEVAELKAARG